MELELLSDSFSLDDDPLLKLAKSFEDSNDNNTIEGEKNEMLKYAINDYINERLG